MPADIGIGTAAYPSLEGLQQPRQNQQPAQPTEVATSVTDGSSRAQEEAAAQRQERATLAGNEDPDGTVTADRGQNLNITA